MVEATRVELVSGTISTRASPGAVSVFTFPSCNAQRQALQVGSFIKSHRTQSFARLVPCLDDAGYPRRRNHGPTGCVYLRSS